MDFGSSGAADRPFAGRRLGLTGCPLVFLRSVRRWRVLVFSDQGFGLAGIFCHRGQALWRFSVAGKLSGRRSLAGISPNQLFRSGIYCSVLWRWCGFQAATGKWFFLLFPAFFSFLSSGGCWGVGVFTFHFVDFLPPAMLYCPVSLSCMPLCGWKGSDWG